MKKNIYNIQNEFTTIGTIYNIITVDPGITHIRLPDGTLLKIKRKVK